MPIRLDNLTDMAAASTVKTYSPTFFSKDLTGRGTKGGLLCEAQNPVHTGNRVRTSVDDLDPVKQRSTNNGVTTTKLPLSILSTKAWGLVNQAPVPADTGVKFATHASRNNFNFHLFAEPHSLILQVHTYVNNGTRVHERKLVCNWRICLMRLSDTPSAEMHKSNSVYDLTHTSSAAWSNNFVNEFDANLPRAFANIADELERSGFAVDRAALNDYLQHISIYDAISERSRVWQESADEEMHILLEEMLRQSQNGKVDLPQRTINVLTDVCGKLESYRMPLGIYRNIYQDIKASLTPIDAKRVCKANLNLMLSDMLSELDADKQNLEKVLPAGTPPPTIDPFYSKEQRLAIASDSPLTLVQSGAGSGKSSLIKGRLNYMRDCGVDLKEALVLSFTNAAADHILDIAPDVHSMTIASMIHKIYSENHPLHELSTEDTLVNSLAIYFPNDPFARNFKRRLLNVMREDDQRALTALNSFVENHFDDVMRCLDVVGQTTLNLEIIICYQCIDTMREPAEVQSRHIIIDEVQDNSIFEFVYILRYVTKNKESLFIVGKLLLLTLNPVNCGKPSPKRTPPQLPAKAAA